MCVCVGFSVLFFPDVQRSSLCMARRWEIPSPHFWRMWTICITTSSDNILMPCCSHWMLATLLASMHSCWVDSPGTMQILTFIFNVEESAGFWNDDNLSRVNALGSEHLTWCSSEFCWDEMFSLAEDGEYFYDQAIFFKRWTWMWLQNLLSLLIGQKCWGLQVTKGFVGPKGP